MQQLSLKHVNGDVRYNNNAPEQLNDCIRGILHLGPNVITFRLIAVRTFITFRPSTTNPALRLQTKTLLILIRLPSRGTTASELVAEKR